MHPRRFADKPTAGSHHGVFTIHIATKQGIKPQRTEVKSPSKGPAATASRV